MNDVFAQGFRESFKTRDEILGAQLGADYVKRVSDVVDQANMVIAELGESDYLIDSLKGFVAERWHAGTFNISTALQGGNERAYFLSSRKARFFWGFR